MKNSLRVILLVIPLFTLLSCNETAEFNLGIENLSGEEINNIQIGLFPGLKLKITKLAKGQLYSYDLFNRLKQTPSKIIISFTDNTSKKHQYEFYPGLKPNFKGDIKLDISKAGNDKYSINLKSSAQKFELIRDVRMRSVQK